MLATAVGPLLLVWCVVETGRGYQEQTVNWVVNVSPGRCLAAAQTEN
jgi:hypothetical protein